MAKSFSELQTLAIQIRDELNKKKNSAQRVGSALLDIIDNCIQNITDIKQKLSVFEHACSGFKRVSSEVQLPVTPSQEDLAKGFLVNTSLYLYVGTGGNAVNGRYFNVGDIRGPQGEPGSKGETGNTGPTGEKGEQGNSGVTGDTSDIVVINNLDGGESEEGSIKVLAAEQGKVLNKKFTELETYSGAIFTQNETFDANYQWKEFLGVVSKGSIISISGDIDAINCYEQRSGEETPTLVYNGDIAQKNYRFFRNLTKQGNIEISVKNTVQRNREDLDVLTKAFNCVIPVGKNLINQTLNISSINNQSKYQLPTIIKRDTTQNKIKISRRTNGYKIDVLFYNSNYELIETKSASLLDVIDIPEECEYIGFKDYGIEILSGGTMINYGEDEMDYEAFVIVETSQLYKKIVNIEDITELSPADKVLKYYNMFNPDDENYKEDYFISSSGQEVTNQYSSAYAVTGFIKVPDYFECISINYEVGNVYAVLYDKNKKVIPGTPVELRNGNRKIKYESRAYYARFTILVNKKESTLISFEDVDTKIPITPFEKVYKLDKPTDEYIKGLIPTDTHILELVKETVNAKTPKYDNSYKNSLSDGGELVLTEIPDNKNYYGIGCNFTTESMGTVKIYKSQNDYCRGEIDIDATNITEYKTGGTTNVIPHGLTITNGLIISIIKTTKDTEIKLTNTSGETVTKTLPNWNGCKGGVIKFVAVSGNYTHVTLTHSGTWMSKDTWIFGDSYTDFWPAKCYENNATNFYLDGYSGRQAQGGYDSLLKALKYGKPKRIIWMLGMNNADTDSAVNESWNTVFVQLKELCANLNIQLILCTIPNVPERIHTFKNQIIRGSGFPYIDIASAVGATEKGSNWYEGLLGSDRVHPSDIGALAIALLLIAGVPDISL